MKALLRSVRAAALIWSLVFVSTAPGRGQNVGIGTTAPTQTLDVNGTLRVRAAAGTGEGRLLGVEADGTLKVQPPLFGASATATPQAPALLGSPASLDGAAGPVRVNPAGTRAYVLAYQSLSNPLRGAFQAFDITAPTPVPVGSPVLTVAGGQLLQLNPTGTRAWAVGQGRLQAFDLSQGQPVALGTEVPVGSDYQAQVVNPAGTRFFAVNSGYPDVELLTYDLTQGGAPTRLPLQRGVFYESVAVNAAGTRLFAAGDSMLTTIDISSGQPVVLNELRGVGTRLHKLVVSPDDTRLYVLDENFFLTPGVVLTFDISSGRPVAVGSPVSIGGTYGTDLTINAAGNVLALQHYLAGTLQVYDKNSSGQLVPRALASVPVGGLALSPDGTRAYYARSNQTLSTYLLASPRVLAVGADGSLGSVDPAQLGDNLGNHTASQNLNLAGKLLVSGGSQGLAIDNGGNVGLGTSAPSARLDVQGSTRLRGLTTAGLVTTDASGNLSSSAGLSIGTTAPAAPLHVASAAVPAAVLEGSNAGPHLELRKPGGGLATIDYIGTDFGGPRGGALELRGASSVQISGNGDVYNPGLTVAGTGRVGMGTTAPRGALDVAAAGDTYLITDPTTGSGQSAYLPGHLYLAPFSGGSGTAFVQARVPNPSSSTRIGLTLRTTNGTNLVDALTLAADGSATLASPLTAPAVTSAATGAANLLAAGYGYVSSLGTPTSASANVTVNRTGPGEYVLSFTGPLAAVDLGSRAVSLTLAGGPGFISFASGSSAGKLLVRTYNTGGTLTDRGFSFVVFQP